ncbi:low temperature requirement protein A [Luedemannella helvata]|uniref:Low temperature requirement protein A n=1 Tax=Luedemannella helvata TaxID=349315 RepID=A0ABP4VYZ8_9ACTN
MAAPGEAGRRVSWIELYFDLVFVFAVSQVAHVMVEHPDGRGVVAALGLFVTLWWTWIGYVILYNRYGEDSAAQRLFMLAGTIPCAIAATQAHVVSDVHLGGLALALAGARVVLAVAFPATSGQGHGAGRAAGLGYAVSAAIFAVSAVVPAPVNYVLWGVALAQEAGFLLLAQARQRRRSGDRTGRRRRPDRRELLAPPAEPGLAVNAPHLAERFNLFMIILLGEIVISVASAAVDAHGHEAGLRVGFLAGLVLAGALWWIYFDSSAGINEFVLRASGGNPAMAYGIYAGGHVPPAFGLLLIAAGVNLSLHDAPPTAATWFVSAGLAAYMVGTRGFTLGVERRWYARLLRTLVVVATVCLALLHRVVSAPTVVVLVAVWAVAVAALVTVRGPVVMRHLREHPLRFFADR